jgi:8-oxo-dGTP diphosphatase
VVQELNPRVYGLWNLPAGHVDKGEDIAHAAIRETKEETGYIVELGNETGVYHLSSTTPVIHAFEARIIGGELKIQPDEILDSKWLTYEEIASLREGNKLRSTWMWDAITKVELSAPNQEQSS